MKISKVFAFWAVSLVFCSSMWAQGTAFTYQGRLNDSNGPANGAYDLQFALFDSRDDGIQQGMTVTNTATPVTNGLFTVTLDFGQQFAGADRWLQLAVRTNGADNFMTLSPRQQVTTVPYAVSAANVMAGGIPAGVYTNAVSFSNVNNQFSGNGSGLSNVVATGFNGLLSPTNLPATVFTNIVLRPNGTNDQTAVIQAAFGTPYSVVNFTPGAYYATNLWLTSNVTVYGNGATLCQLAAPSQGFSTFIGDPNTNTAWNALIDMGNNNVNQSIYNLTLDGMKPSDYEAQNFPIWTGVDRGFYGLRFCATGNHGLLFNQAAGGEVTGCRAQNFSGCGFFIYSSADQLSYMGSHSVFHDNVAFTNYLGFYVQAWGGTHPSLYGNAEYSLLSGLVANDNAIGMDDGASNSQLHDSSFNHNYVGINITAGNGNSGPHTRFHHINLNHNYCGFWIGATDYIAIDNLYEAVVSTNFIKNGHPLFYNCSVANIWIDGQGHSWNTNTWVSFNSCDIQYINITSNNVSIEDSRVYGGQISFTGNTLEMVNCHSAYSFNHWLGDVVTNINNTGTYIGFGNHETMGTNTDGTVWSVSSGAGSQGITTNITGAGITFYITNGLIMKVSDP